jgi:energy-coupling factor transporter transmembrane protein EcfT
MQALSDLGAQELAPFFSSSLYTIVATLALTAIVLLLMSLTPRLTALLFRRLTPDWIDGATTLLLALLLVGQATILLRWLWLGLPYLWPLFLVVTLVIAAFLPANPLSDALAYWRLRRDQRYQVGDRITVGQQQGQVVALRPLYTEFITATADRMRLPNSVILRRALVVHGKVQTTTKVIPTAMTTGGALSAKDTQAVTATALMAAPATVADALSVTTVDPAAPTALPEASAPPITGTPPGNTLARPLPPWAIPPLRQRQGLGAITIKGLMRA